jgi:hypothetical protein
MVDGKVFRKKIDRGKIKREEKGWIRAEGIGSGMNC